MTNALGSHSDGKHLIADGLCWNASLFICWCNTMTTTNASLFQMLKKEKV